MDTRFANAPDRADLLHMAQAAIAALPGEFRVAALQVGLQIDDFASDDILETLGIDDPFGLTGLYEGIPLTEKSVLDQVVQPDLIRLFRRPILDEWVARGDVTLPELVTHVLVHELAHHFGWSDDDIARIDRWWE